MPWCANPGLGRDGKMETRVRREGYDSPPMCAPSTGGIVAAFLLGIYTRAEQDVRYTGRR